MLPLTTTIAEDGVYWGYGVNSFLSKWAGHWFLNLAATIQIAIMSFHPAA